MTKHRTSRLNEQFKREISGILSNKVRDPRVGSVLVTEVRVTPDLWLARVFFRALDPEQDIQETLQGLEAAAPFIRKELGKDLRIRRTPELRFLHDDTLDSALRIEKVLSEVLPEPDPAEEGLIEEGSEEMEEGPSSDAEDAGL